MITEAKKHVNEAFRLISVVSVHGDAVDVMAQARRELRAAFALLKETERAEDTAEPEEASADG